VSHKIGLVLSGGGGKGAYQIGVWKALRERGVARRIDVIAGTSIGALNAALMLQDDFGLAEAVWSRISPEQALKPREYGHLTGVSERVPFVVRRALARISQTGLFSQAGLIETIDHSLKLSAVATARRVAYASCCCVWPPTGQAVYFKLNGLPEERIKTVLLASAAIPIAFDLVDIDGKKYCDGGAVDQVPVRPVYDEGCDVIFVVHLDRTPINNALYPGATLIHIVPSENVGEFLDGVMDFNPENVRWRIEIGYRDALRTLDALRDVSGFRLGKRMHLNNMAPIPTRPLDSRQVTQALIDNFKGMRGAARFLAARAQRLENKEPE